MQYEIEAIYQLYIIYLISEIRKQIIPQVVVQVEIGKRWVRGDTTNANIK